jgi:transposase
MEESKTIRLAMEKKENKKYYKRMLAVALRGEGKANNEIGLITGYHPKRVSQLVSLYANKGIQALASDGRKGGNHRNMSDIQEAELLEQFEERAKKGQIITVKDIARAYDQATGKEHKSLSTCYSFLHNNDWRLITPRRQHPGKASNEAIEASKKLTKNLKK